MATNMKKLNCLFLKIAIEFKEDEFKKEAFILDVGATEKEADDNAFSWSYGSKLKTKNEHGHLFIRFDGDQSVVSISFNQGKNHDDDVREPYIENLMNWIGSFFANPLKDVSVTVLFEYDTKYEPLIKLNYPLLIDNPFLDGAKVTGYDIYIPSGSTNYRLHLMSKEDEIGIFYSGDEKIDLLKFNYIQYLTQNSQFANSLVKIKGE
jgi:hypothetical protein